MSSAKGKLIEVLNSSEGAKIAEYFSEEVNVYRNVRFLVENPEVVKALLRTNPKLGEPISHGIINSRRYDKFFTDNNAEMTRLFLDADAISALNVSVALASSEVGQELLKNDNSALATELVRLDKKSFFNVSDEWLMNQDNLNLLAANNGELANKIAKADVLNTSGVAKGLGLTEAGRRLLVKDDFKLAKRLSNEFSTDEVSNALMKAPEGIELIKSGGFLSWFKRGKVSDKAKKVSGFIVGLTFSEEGIDILLAEDMKLIRQCLNECDCSINSFRYDVCHSNESILGEMITKTPDRFVEFLRFAHKEELHFGWLPEYLLTSDEGKEILARDNFALAKEFVASNRDMTGSFIKAFIDRPDASDFIEYIAKKSPKDAVVALCESEKGIELIKRNNYELITDFKHDSINAKGYIASKFVYSEKAIDVFFADNMAIARLLIEGNKYAAALVSSSISERGKMLKYASSDMDRFANFVQLLKDNGNNSLETKLGSKKSPAPSEEVYSVTSLTPLTEAIKEFRAAVR